MTEIVVKPAADLRWEVPHDTSANRITDLAEVRRYIDAIDFGPLKHRLTQGRDVLGSEWSPARADYYERLYKNWLYLRRRYEGELLPPHIDIDEFWHGHILDTHAYFAHCDRIFGYYFHHFPYFGTRGPADRTNLSNAWQQTQDRYHAEFGEYIYDFVE
ncbi:MULTISPECIES: hypothetical protein [unclassified Micromonospora]|uniref:glycine-rich domain-containing protein n=1 Tax=unclassified Micromonospora TaxID=2617518 RepID=UPI0022B5FCE8|nr:MULTISPECIES: hypothetical protein [unclassified Micromonospora]MCZ7423893.1 hypothetical protein [Verrucosispora sp. WMMA2121]WBB91645.1 hypothetical protein O7597_00945 [Verrucosispora sp. WMMC514]